MADLIPQSAPLVETESLKHNLMAINSCVDVGACILLEGETGIGKSALIVELARRRNKPLIRFNMSSKLSTSSFFGTPVLRSNATEDGSIGMDSEVVFQEGPFTAAFRYGYWLLLDEFNLVPESVLSSLEQALDFGRLSITSPVEIGEGNRFVEFERHPDFALFATQNPCTGLFKGAREQHSSTLLGRFTPVTITNPSELEVQQIVFEMLERNGFQHAKGAALTERIIDFHRLALAQLRDTAFLERSKR